MNDHLVGDGGGEGASAEPPANWLGAILESISDVVTVYDRDWRIVYANSRLSEVTGKSLESLLGKMVWDVFPDLANTQLYRDLHRALDEQVAVRLETYQMSLGTWFEVRGVPFDDGLVVISRDITERKQAEEARKKSEEFARGIVESSRDCIEIIDLAGQIAWMSENGRQLLELPEPPPVLNWVDQWKGSDRYAASAAFEIARTGGTGRFQGFSPTASGTPRWWDVSLTPMLGPNGSPERILAIARDITEQKRVEQVLRASERRFSVAFNASPHPMTITSLEEGRVIDANQCFLETTGYSREEVIGRTTLDMNLWVREEDRSNLVEKLRKNRTVRNLEALIRTKTGDQRTMLLSAEAIELGGEPVILMTTNDITERKHLEEQLRHSQRLEAVGRLAGGIAHDFNNVLTVITNYSQILLNALQPGDPLRKEAEQIRKAGERAAVLTRQLLAFSRKQMLQPKVFDLNATVVSMAKMLERLIGEDIELKVVTDAALTSVRADPGQVEQVLVNIVVNARDAMPEGGELTIETRNVEFVEGYAGLAPGLYVLLSVKDTGYGIDPEVQAHIFEPFFTTKERGKGTGLGLSTVYGIVTQSGGHVEITSQVGVGTEIRIFLPRIEGLDRDTGTFDKSKINIAGPGGSETILLVEDDDDVRFLVRETLESAGYTVLEAASGGEALEIYQEYQGPIHLLVTDVVMPGMSGRQLVERLGLTRPQMKVLYMSGYTDDAIVQRGVFEEAVAFISKPFTPDAFWRKVRDVLDT